MRLRVSAVALSIALFAVPAIASTPFISNDVKYKDSSKQHATGRDGGASMEARALLGKDGATDLEISAAGGSLAKVQLKLPGDVTENFNGLSGASFSQRLTGLAPGTPVGVQASVDTGDRTGVISASETVKLRPDLMVVNVSAAPHAVIGAPYSITAAIREANGDVGARASCVLYADGVEVDRANGIWVDAGGTVSCEMAHTFGSAGTSQLSIAVTGVAPGDFDGSNNSSAPVSVRVYERVSELEPWNAAAHDQVHDRRNWYRTPYYETESTSQGWLVGVSFSTMFYESDLDVRNLRASVSASTDGRLINEVKDVSFDYEESIDWYDDTLRQCSIATFDGGYSGVSSCRISTPWDGSRVSFSYRFNAGETTYVSRGWSRTYLGGGQYGGVYYWNSTMHSAYGTRFELGNTVSLSVQFSDGSRYFEANPFMTLEAGGWSNESPDTCTPDGTWCSGYRDVLVSRDAVVGSW